MRMQSKKLDSFRHRFIPLSAYWMKDFAKQLASNKNFHDALASTFALASIAIAFPFLPLPILALLLILLFGLTLLHPLLGLMALLLSSLPMYMYQVPLLAWFMMLFIAIALFFGYKHYRTITYIYSLMVIPFSPLGYVLEIPAFTVAVLVLGLRRSAVLTLIVIFLVAAISGSTGIQVSGPIVYNATLVHSQIENLSYAKYLTPSSKAATLGTFPGKFLSSASKMFSSDVAGSIFLMFGAMAGAVVSQFPYTALQAIVWLFVVFMMDNYAIKSRSPYKGALASCFGILILASAFAFSGLENLSFSYWTLLSFLATPLFLFTLEAAGIDVVKALDVMKQDILTKFGVAFEDLTQGTHETLADVADYEETKKELGEAILAPTEHREISGAYGVKPAKGILLFGPPGTGKTFMMRALSNEIKVGFYYIKASSLLSPYAGESSQALVKIFTNAKKHMPCLLFIDEIYSIASRRELQEATGREIMTTLLTEMDGFQKMESVIIVGATNAPQLLDPSIMRAGRFDKIIYMPLPDIDGRAEIFEHYLSKLPIEKNIDYKKLASVTVRYSGADIKNICDEVTRKVGEEAIAQREVLEIRMVDVVSAVKVTKPSTSLAQLEEYNAFKLDYERRTHQEVMKEDEAKIKREDVIGLNEAKKALHEAIDIPILHPKLIKKYDVGSIKGILLFGPPGTGKTMLMTAVANELEGVHMITVSGNDIARYGPGKTLSTIKELFDRAKENAPSILFFDELDALIPLRDTASETGTQLTGQFLEEFDKIKDTSSVVVVAATNRPDMLDPAILRPGRFDRLIFISPPEREDRKTIFENDLKKSTVSREIDYEALAAATEGFTGADIANICRQVKMNALESSLQTGNTVEIKNDDLMKLIQKTRPSAPAIVMGRYLQFFSKYGRR